MLCRRMPYSRLGAGVVGAVLALAAAALPAQTVTSLPPPEQAARQLRLAALGFIEKGQWSSAGASVDKLLASQPDDPVGLELRRLVGEYQRLGQARRGRREAAFKESSATVARFIADQNWEEALAEATRTADLAENKADLARTAWFPTLVSKCEQAAEAHRDKGEWLKATGVYAQLSALYEKDEQYKALARKTARYARLEAGYRDKDESAKQIEKIDESMMADALTQIRKFYVTEPDFKKMTLGGLDSLVALTEVPSLRAAFDPLNDLDRRDQFRKRVGELRAQTAERGEMGLDGLAKAYLEAKEINRNTLQLPEGAIIREFFDGALEPLDKFSAMIWPAEKSEFEKTMDGEFSGVGIQISLEDGQLTVVSPLGDTPAYHAGIQAGDVVVAIDGVSALGITLDQAVQRITGPVGTAVVLTIRRANLAKPKDFRIVRDRIKIVTVKGNTRDDKGQWQYLADPDYRIGYVRITNYMKHTVDELEAAMDAMAAQNVRALVVDLRFNPGGLLNQAVEMGDLFIDAGPIVSTEGRAVRRVEERAHSGGTNTSLPLVVLVNGYSASAAEIVSGALKDTDRAIIVGDRTYGKGSVQNVIPVGADRPGMADAHEAPAYLKLTTAYYYLPSGQSIHRRDDSETWGVEPTVKVDLTRDEIQDVLDLRRTSDVIHVPGEAPTTQPDAAAAPATQPDRVPVDPQMDVALLILRAELLKKQL